MNCELCGKVVPPERVEAVPWTRVCVGCAQENPEPFRHDPEVVCFKSSPSGQNGWSAKS